MPNVRKEDEEVFGGQALQSYDWPTHVDETAPGESVLGQSALQRRITIEAATRVEQELRRPAEQEAEGADIALKRVVDDRKNLLVVRVARCGCWSL